MYENQIVVASEAVLALYPILIKTVPTNLTTQLLSRFTTFSFLAALFGSSSDLRNSWGSLAAAAKSTALGTITLSHVATSYYAFEQLPAGVAMSLFYTYPFWNLLGGALGLGESITSFQLLLTGVAFLGVVLVSLGTKEGEDRAVNWAGILSALAAAITETAMFFAVKGAAQKNPFFSTLELYPGALLGLAAFLLASPRSPTTAIDLRAPVWSKMLAFNAVVGFAGYAFRFYAIPKMTTAAFSILSFVGVVASFIWGWLFVGEKPTSMTMLGAALISAAAAAVGK